ncbi:lipopolysaccharide biosynthesis protein [Ferrimonas sp.]|uniref:lipopolysaccharide biosynthesis protein n=1 Tax=Ferrimonas sp. TaxID=2080861 RepID=UPI003A92B4D8
MKSKVVVSAIDQGLLSAFNFGLNLVLIKFWTPALFGVYSILFTLTFVFISLQNALINTPYSVLVPARENPASLRQTLSWGNVLFLIALAVGCTLLQMVPGLNQSYVSPALVSLFFVIRLLREYFRCRWSAELELMPVLWADLAFVLLFTLGAGLLWWQLGWANVSLTQLLWLLCISQLLSLAYMMAKELPLLQPLGWRQLATQYAPVWQQSRWSLVGVSTTEIQNRGYIFVVGLLFGSTMVGFIQAGRVFFGPLNIITSAWTRVAKPTLARLNAQGKQEAFQKLVRQGLIGFLLFNLLFSLALYLFWPLLDAYLFSDDYRNVGWVTLQWAIVTLLFHLRATGSAAIQAQNRFKPLAKATLWGALFSLSSLVLIGLTGGGAWVVVSVIIGEAVAFGYVLRLLQRPRQEPIAQGVTNDN